VSRCGKCKNCLELEKVKARVLACANPPFSHADDGVVELWNKELERLPCTNKKVEVILTLTESQWCELANAIATKIDRVRRCEYEDMDDEHDPEAWVKELESIYNRVADELQKKGVTY
jgi:hypothetical protein